MTRALTLALVLAAFAAPVFAADPVGRRVDAEGDFRRLHAAYSYNEQCRFVKGRAALRLKDAFYAANTELMRSGAWDKVQYQRYFSASAPILSRVECKDPLARRMVDDAVARLGGR